MQGGSILGHKNESLVDEWLTDDRLMLLECWARDGIKMSEMADRIGISNSMFVEWRKEYPEIGNAVKNGKEIVDYKVENALLKAALGYTTKEIKVTIGKQQKNGKTFMITKETTEKEVAPNVTACLAWLNNRMPDRWKRNRDKEVLVDDEDSNVQITIVRGANNKLEDNVNKEIKLENKNQEKEEEQKVNSKKQDLDYWPDDWNEDEE